ncbi:MAG: inositol monophosphatase family protein [Actinomycetes bacterium]
MASASAILSFDWLELSARCAASLGELLAATPQRDDRVVETGTIGAGGDRTLVIDEQAEEIVFAELKKLFDAGARFTALSEERGVVDFGSDEAFVVIDPIDGSLNAKRGLPAYSISIAVADGPTMADVGFGFVHDFGSDEQWHAIRGEGAWLNGQRLAPVAPERRSEDGRLEVVLVEGASPFNLAASTPALIAGAHRVRAFGSMAISCCQVAAGRADAMVSLWSCRPVDIAASQLVVREAGGEVAFPAADSPLALPLADSDRVSAIVAAPSAAALADALSFPAL